jgi:hypothetical protein
MSKRVSGSVLLLTTLALSLVVGDVLVRGAQDPQNQPATPPTQTPPKSTPRPPKGKRGLMKMNTPANETTTGDQTTPATTPADTTMPATMPMQNAGSMASTQTDLSGTYAGTFNCDALGLTGDTTLTINGNQFTTADGKTGRIVASTTHGYTAVALQTGDVATGTTPTTPGAAATTPPQIVSLRAHHSGNRLTLTSVPGATMPCSFSSSRNVARRMRQTPSAAGTTVASPAEAGATPTDVTTPAKPARNRRGNRRTMTPTTNPTETPAQPAQPTPETPTPSQTPSPEPTQTPSPEPAPSPNPSPSGSPTPMPNPSPSPTATPSPTPSPSPRPRG